MVQSPRKAITCSSVRIFKANKASTLAVEDVMVRHGNQVPKNTPGSLHLKLAEKMAVQKRCLTSYSDSTKIQQAAHTKQYHKVEKRNVLGGKHVKMLEN